MNELEIVSPCRTTFSLAIIWLCAASSCWHWGFLSYITILLRIFVLGSGITENLLQALVNSTDVVCKHSGYDHLNKGALFSFPILQMCLVQKYGKLRLTISNWSLLLKQNCQYGCWELLVRKPTTLAHF